MWKVPTKVLVGGFLDQDQAKAHIKGAFSLDCPVCWPGKKKHKSLFKVALISKGKFIFYKTKIQFQYYCTFIYMYAYTWESDIYESNITKAMDLIKGI